MSSKSERKTFSLDHQLASDLEVAAAAEDVPEAQIARKWLRAGRDKLREETLGRRPPERP